ncbi:MAG: cohesin domain-containing protein, partial [Bacteroidota bacterium]
MKKVILSICCLLFLAGLHSKQLWAQNPVVRLDSVSVCDGASVQVPINMRNFPSIGALSLAIQYDPAALTFLGSNGSALTTDSLIVSAYSPSEIRIAWAATQTPATLLNDVLVNLSFQAHASTVLSFHVAQSEIVDYNFTVLDSINFLNGYVAVTPLPIFAGGITGTLTVPISGSTTLNASVTGASAYRWQMSTDGGNAWMDLQDAGHYLGVFTPQLQITGIKAAMSGYLYRLQASEGGQCLAMSSSAALNVLIPNIGVGSTSACLGDTVVVAVSISNAVNIAALSMRLHFNNQLLQFVDAIHTDPQIASISTNLHPSGESVVLAWNDTASANLNGTIQELRFIQIGTGSSGLEWDRAIGILADSAAQIFDSLSYTDGSTEGLNSGGSEQFVDICAPS